MSDVPEATIRKVLSGETPDPRFETIVKMVTSVGGSIDDILAGSKKEAEIENKAVTVLKESYDGRIEALTERIEALRERVEDVKKYAEALHKDKRILAIVVAVLMLVIVGLFTFDIAIDSHGWVRY